MTITQEKIEILAKYMSENEERAEMLMALPAEEACTKINADGYDFTADELADFAEELKKAIVVQNGELDEEELNQVNGGCDPVTLSALLILATATYVNATIVEIWLMRKHGYRR